MQVRVLDIDGSLLAQHGLLDRTACPVVPLARWGPRIRLACTFGRFSRFERSLAKRLGEAAGPEPVLTYYGSGDFHHVSLALLRRIRTPFNLVVLDNHPDWMRGVPLLHCGTWLYHAARLPQVRRVFHVGGDVDFDNYYRWMAPWDLIEGGKVVVFPAVRRYRRGRWARVEAPTLRFAGEGPFPAERVEELLAPYRKELRSLPLYVSLDKDVMVADDAVVNWDSGHLTMPEVQKVLRSFVAAAKGRLAGADVLGDWSPVAVGGLLRRFLHWTEHPALDVEPGVAAACNEAANLKVLRAIGGVSSRLEEVVAAGRAA